MCKDGTELHGGNIYKLFREKNIKNILDYSSNINPYGVPEKLRKIITGNMDILERYPDPDYIELRSKIAKNNKVDIKNVILGNGATEIIFLLMKVLAPKKVLVVSPTFTEYERAINAARDEKKEKVEINHFPLQEEDGFILNINLLIGQLDRNYDLLIMCNPNNPTGKFVLKEDMEKILEKCNRTETKFFIDEAFIDFIENGSEQSIVNTLKNKTNLFVVRAFTKYFAIPGLRLGYGLCFDENLSYEVYKKKEPWSVNNIAELAGMTVLDDAEYIEKTDKWIREEKKYMYEKLEKIKEIKPYKTEVNFILVKIDRQIINEKGLNVHKLKEEMLRKGILIRDASDFRYLDESYFRLAIKDRVNNDRVLNTLKEIINYVVR